MTPIEKMNNEISFLGQMQTLLARSDRAYAGYLENGKTFLYAKILKDTNDALRHLILAHAHLLPPSQTGNAQTLLHHIDVWGALWEEVQRKSKPSLETVFVFENRVTFPRSEVANLMAYYETLKNGELNSKSAGSV